MGGWIGWAMAQAYTLYSPSDPDWRQGRHDYKKTARAPLRCSSPPSSFTFTERQDPNDSYIYLVTADRNWDGTSEIFYVGDDRGISNGSPEVWMTASGSLLCDNSFWADQAAGDCAITASGTVYCPLTETDAWGGVDTYFSKDNGACGEVYRQSFDSEAHSSLTIDDVNGDGTPEIYWGIGAEAHAVNGATNSYSTFWRRNLGSNVGTPVIGDFNGDGNKDVCFPLANGSIRCLNPLNGADLWTTSTPCGWGPSITSGEYGPASERTQVIMADDFDRDGDDELVILGSSCTALYNFSGSGFVQVWRAPYGSDRAGAIGDLNGDGFYDVVIGNSGTFYVLNGLNGALVASYTPAYGGTNQNCSAPTIADINGDGWRDVLTACYRPVAYSASNGWSSPVWVAPNSSPYSISSDLVVAKVTNNTLMVVYGDYSCYVDIWTCPVATLGEGDQELGAEEKPSYVESFDVYAVKGGVVITGFKGEVSVYTPSGSLVKKVNVDGRTTLTLKPGVYVVKAGEKVQAVVVR